MKRSKIPLPAPIEVMLTIEASVQLPMKWEESRGPSLTHGRETIWVSTPPLQL